MSTFELYFEPYTDESQTKLGKSVTIIMDMLLKICEVLDCALEDIMETTI